MLLAKFDDPEYAAICIDSILRRLPIRQGDKSFTCRVWTIDAVYSLQVLGAVMLKVPLNMIPVVILKFGEAQQDKIVTRRVMHNNCKSDAVIASAILDLRGWHSGREIIVATLEGFRMRTDRHCFHFLSQHNDDRDWNHSRC